MYDYLINFVSSLETKNLNEIMRNQVYLGKRVTNPKRNYRLSKEIGKLVRKSKVKNLKIIKIQLKLTQALVELSVFVYYYFGTLALDFVPKTYFEIMIVIKILSKFGFYFPYIQYLMVDTNSKFKITEVISQISLLHV